jgi:hypothetical protein
MKLKIEILDMRLVEHGRREIEKLIAFNPDGEVQKAISYLYLLQSGEKVFEETRTIIQARKNFKRDVFTYTKVLLCEIKNTSDRIYKSIIAISKSDMFESFLLKTFIIGSHQYEMSNNNIINKTISEHFKNLGEVEFNNFKSKITIEEDFIHKAYDELKNNNIEAKKRAIHKCNVF